MLAPVVLSSHKVGWIYEKGKETAIEFVRVEKFKGTRPVVSIDMFEAGALGWYL